VISVIDVVAHQGYTLSVQQTPPIPSGAQKKGKGKKGKGNGNGNGRQTFCREDIERVEKHLKHLPTRSPSSQSGVQTTPAELGHWFRRMGIEKAFLYIL
jgi:hypothetical protein